MRKLILSLLAVATLAVVAAPAVIGGGAIAPQVAQAHVSCYDFWRSSGHTTNVRWYHCHSWTNIYNGLATKARVHICGYSRTLHGISVTHNHEGWGDYRRGSDAHETYGEGC